MKTPYFVAGLAALTLIVPCTRAVTITQTTTITGSAFDGSTARIFGGWNFTPYTNTAAPLGSVTLVADISAHASSDWLHPFGPLAPAPILVVPSLSTSTAFNFFAEPFTTPSVGSSYVAPSRLLYPGVPYFASADFAQHWERTFTSAAELAMFTRANPQFLFVSEFNGSGIFGSVSGSETVTLALTFSTVPDGANPAVMLALVCCGLFVAAHRFTSRGASQPR